MIQGDKRAKPINILIMKKRWITFSTAFLLSVMVSCGGGKSGNEDYAGYDDYPIESSENYYDEEGEAYLEEEFSETTDLSKDHSPEQIEIERKLIKTGYLEFEVEDFSEMKKIIHTAVEKNDAYISQEHEYSGYQRVNTSVEIRVPAANFETLLSEVTVGVEDFDTRDIEVSDVTEEFIDLEARIKTKKELEAQYHELLDKAQSVGDILEIEREISYLREEIESLEGRLRYLSKSVSYSTLTILYYKTVPEQNKFGNKFETGFESGWDNLILLFVALTHVWPFILIGIILILIFKLRRKNKK